MTFVHLHVHTEYSMVDSLLRIPALVARAVELEMPALAVTDVNNLFAAIKFYQAAEQAGIKPIIGADVWVATGEDPRSRLRMVLLCRDADGYRNLCSLISKSYRHSATVGPPCIQEAWFTTSSSSGLIALAATRNEAFASQSREGTVARLRTRIEKWMTCFPECFYLELTRTGREDETKNNAAAIALAEQYQLPVVATNDVRFLHQSNYEAHEARVCIHDGRTLSDPRRERLYSEQQYLRSAADMAEIFSDIPEAVENTTQIAMRCNLEFEFGRYHLPKYPCPEGKQVDDLLRDEARAGLARRLAASASSAGHGPPEDTGAYTARLEQEVDVITSMGFSGYFLIVADFILWAKRARIPVGPGRGSGAGSLVAYALGVTEVDPLSYDLLFERFLNPERVSMPDFDVDFCMARRDEVIDYVTQRYGLGNVAQIITYGTMAAKAVLRDVGRVLAYPYGFVDQLAKLIPFDLNMTLARALDEEPALKARYEQEDDVRAMIDLAQSLEGLVRNAGKHAGGLVIAPRPLEHFMPLYVERDGVAAVTQFDMADVEAVGLVKFDFLGLRTLTIIDWAIREINAVGDNVAIEKIPLDDESAYRLIQRAQTTAVFQLESRGMRELIKRLKPDSFEDLIALVALYRPGPLQSGMVDDFIDRKHGRAVVRYPHPALEQVLKPTYGVILYQEQVMQIAQVLAGYTLGAADLLRRAMGKKKAEEMAQQRSYFVSGAQAQGVEAELAAQIFDLMEKFAGYGFNKSHSVAYALVAYQTAWLKAHYPAAFMAAVLSADMDSTDKVVRLIDECRKLGLTVVSPDINFCEYRFTVADHLSIRYGLGAIKGVGEGVVDALAKERRDNGAYRDLFDLCRRNDGRKLNRRTLEALIKAGALDCFGATRRGLMEALEPAIQAAEQQARAVASGQTDLFGIELGSSGAAGYDNDEHVATLAVAEWSKEQLLSGEKETLGLYLSGHPFDAVENQIDALITSRLGDLKKGSQRIAGLIVALRFTKSRRGRMAILTLDDKSARIEVTVFNAALETALDKLAVDRIVVIEGECEIDDFSGEFALNAQRVYHLEEAREVFARSLVLSIGAQEANGLAAFLRDTLSHHTNGTCPIVVEYNTSQGQARMRLADEWKVNACDALITALTTHLGDDHVRVEYRGRERA